jgi:hypothetical protein
MPEKKGNVVYRQYLPSKLNPQEKKLQRDGDRDYMKQFFPWITNKWWQVFEAAEEKYYAAKEGRRMCYYDMTQALINFVNCGPSDVKASDIARYLEGRPRRQRYMTRLLAFDKTLKEKWSRYQFRALVNQQYEIRVFGTKSNVHLRDFKAACGYQGRQTNWDKLDQAGFVYVPKVFPDMSKVMSDYLYKEPGSVIYMPTDVIPKDMRMLPIETLKSGK